jgi:tetratricopeptide (TPR) repeat protein
MENFMNTERNIRPLVWCFFICLFLLLATNQPSAQTAASADRQRALDLVKEQKLVDALPVLEKIATTAPDDVEIHEGLIMALMANSVTEKAPAAQAVIYNRVRGIALRFTSKGKATPLFTRVLEIFPQDIDASAAAPAKDASPAERALMEGEEAFNKGDFTAALAGYGKAEKLDPKLYEAPLYLGDVYWKLEDITKAGESYARAIAIDPDRDTAYRFWGNVLMSSDKMAEAREKLINAVVAQPYQRATWSFLGTWAEKNNVKLAHPRVVIPNSVSTEKGKTTITVDPKTLTADDGGSYWIAYSAQKALWMNEKFAKEFPKDTKYRHSLREEADCLRLVATMAADKKNISDVSITNLVKLEKEGLLEAFILFSMADQGISQDYSFYRKNNREKLRKYLMDYVTSYQQ